MKKNKTNIMFVGTMASWMMLAIMEEKIYSTPDRDKYLPKYSEYKLLDMEPVFFASFYYTILGEQLSHIYQIV
jgi:hypothetical protein